MADEPIIVDDLWGECLINHGTGRCTLEGQPGHLHGAIRLPNEAERMEHIFKTLNLDKANPLGDITEAEALGDTLGSINLGDSTENEDLYEQRAILGQALRRVVEGYKRGEPGFMLRDAADRALERVFPGDPLGNRAMYDCPMWDGSNPIEDVAEEGR